MMKTSFGSTTYQQDVPYQVLVPETGGRGCPLIIALHGMGQSGAIFAERTASKIGGHDRVVLIPDGPLPFEVNVKGERREGKAWYIYTGDQEAFLESVKKTEAHLLDLIDRVIESTEADPDRVWLMGFSQGGYAAGVVALRHCARFAGLVSVSSRIKAEILDGERAPDGAPRLFALHGASDTSVNPEAARESVEQLKALGFDATFELFDSGHRINDAMLLRLNEILPGKRP